MTFKMTKTDPFTGKANTIELPLTMKDYLTWRDSDVMIQNAFPHLTDDQREFIMTGIMPDSWEEIFKGQTDEDLEVDKGI